MTAHQAIAAPGCDCDGQDILPSLISISEALARIAANVAPVRKTEVVPLERALGRTLAQPVRSQRMAPSFDNAAMDGYAVATSALTGNGPWRLPVVARVPAGNHPSESLVGRTAARIFTGAPIPEGSDAVVMQESVTRDGNFVHLSRSPSPGMNIRRAGSDMARGATVLDKGEKLGPRQIAACASAGSDVVCVRRRIRAALLVTGNEVRRTGGELDSAQIWDVNTPMLMASLTAMGVEIVACEHADDDLYGLVRQLDDMAARADLVITTGGISVGEEDHVKPAVAALRGDFLFSGVAIKPGKPVSFGRIGKAHWLGLPGNPLSAFVTWQLFGVELLRNLSDERPRSLERRNVVTACEIHRKPGRCELRPAMLAGFDAHGREIVSFDTATHSARVGHLPMADGLLFLPADAETLPAGALVEFQQFCQA